MYNPMLDVFITVSDCGSFTKAAEHLYISPTAVMKQMNTLENHLDLKLFERTPSGIHLTSAGEIIYRDAKSIIEFSNKSIADAKSALYNYDTTFCVGTSLLNPAKPFMDLWYKVNKDFPNYKLHLVPFEDNHDGILSEIKQLGEKFDFLIGACDSKAWESLCSIEILGEYKLMAAVSREHRLAQKSIINIEDLYGETLMMVCRGDSNSNDNVRDFLQKNHPQINIEDTPKFYDLSVFNRCAESNNVLLTLECWKDIHPALVTIPINWDYTTKYGILYSHDAPDDVRQFIKIARDIKQKNPLLCREPTQEGILE